MISFIKNLFPDFLKVIYHKVRFLISNYTSGQPDKKLKLIGVTGSSGKSTTAFMIYHILKESNIKVGLISTVGAYMDGEEIDIGLHVTTPDAHNIPKLLRKMVLHNCEYAVIEVSSHALSQGRLGFLQFDLSTITNITSDHLDWHKSWENYAEAKSKIVEMTRRDGTVILNADDKKGTEYLEDRFSDISNLSFVKYSKNDITENKSDDTQSFKFQGIKFYIPVFGSYNILNALASTLISKVVGVPVLQSSKALSTFKTLPGHMEILKASNPKIILDFAHNTDSLEKSLIEVKNSLKHKGKLIAVFGSAGLRDIKKRYDMGLSAAKYCDIVIVVPEDPRTESLYEINSKIIKGCEDGGLGVNHRFSNHNEYISKKEKLESERGIYSFDYEEVQARIDGIELGIELSKKDDILITQGKGHEKSLCFGKTEHPYDEKKVIHKLLKSKDK
jgi:UDP-N-acetylmuramoyl-L-alanyl-D-glutamate--2,6-diaminopimelate ligase